MLAGALAGLEGDLRAELLEEWQAFGLVPSGPEAPQPTSRGAAPCSEGDEDADKDPGPSGDPTTPGSSIDEDAAHGERVDAAC